MMKYFKTAILFLACSTNFYFSQHKFLDYPKIAEEELKKTSSTIDKSAPAEILYNSVRYNIEGLECEKTVFTKIKIYDRKRAEKWLNIQIPVSGSETLGGFNVNLYTDKNGKVETIDYNKREQLKENFVKGLKFYKMAIPGVSDGDVIEFSYKLKTNIFRITHYLEEDIPIVYQEYNLEHPDKINYSFNGAGSLVEPQYHVSESIGRLGENYMIERFGFTNMKPLKDEDFVRNINKYRKRIKPEIRRYGIGTYSYRVYNTWNEIAKELDLDDNFGVIVKASSKDVLPSDIKNTLIETERADKIFEFVKANYKWNRNEGIFSSQTLRQTIKTKEGNVADINLLLVNLMKNAGLEAYPFLLSTVDNGILNILSPFRDGLNFVIAAVKINKQIYFYDATSPNSKANLLPERDWNDFGVLIEGEKGMDVTFSNTNLSTKDFSVKAKIDMENGSVVGDFSHKETGMYAIESYDENEVNPESYKDTFKTEYHINTKNVVTEKTAPGEFLSKMNFTDANEIDAVGSKLIFNPLLFLKPEGEMFDQKEERKHPIEFTSPFYHKKVVEIELPQGFKVADLPKPKQTRTDDNELFFKYNCELVNENLLRVTSEIKVGSSTYPKEYYTFFKQIWKLISDAENQVVSLTKK